MTGALLTEEEKMKTKEVTLDRNAADTGKVATLDRSVADTTKGVTLDRSAADRRKKEKKEEKNHSNPKRNLERG